MTEPIQRLTMKVEGMTAIDGKGISSNYNKLDKGAIARQIILKHIQENKFNKGQGASKPKGFARLRELWNRIKKRFQSKEARARSGPQAPVGLPKPIPTIPPVFVVEPRVDTTFRPNDSELFNRVSSFRRRNSKQVRYSENRDVWVSDYEEEIEFESPPPTPPPVVKKAKKSAK